MRVSAPATTFVLLGLATLAATTTATTGKGTCTPRNWLYGQAMSSSMAAASVGLDLPGIAPLTAALDLTCLGGLPAHTGKETFPSHDRKSIKLVPKTIEPSMPWAAPTTKSCAAFAGMTAMATISISTEMVETFFPKWVSSSSRAILWHDMGFLYFSARPAGIPPPRRRIAKGALQALIATALFEVKSFMMAQLRAWGLNVLAVSALFAAPWRTGLNTFVRTYTIAKNYTPALLTGLLCVYTAVVFLIAVGGMIVIFSTTSWHMSVSRPGLEAMLEGDGKEERKEEEKEDWVMVEMEEEMDGSKSWTPTEQQAVGQEGRMSVLSVILSSYIVISTAGAVLLVAVLMCVGPLLFFIEFIITTTNKATSTEEGEEGEVDLLLDGLLGDFAPVLPGLTLAGLGDLISYLRLLLIKENILAKAAAAMDAVTAFEHSVQPFYEDCVNITWYLLAGLALLTVALVVLLARVALWTFVKVLGTFVVEEAEEEEEGGAVAYPDLLPLAYLFAVLAIPGTFWVAGIILVIYFALPDASKEELLSISASGADTERYRSESGLPSAARRVLQRVSVSCGIGRTSSVEVLKKEEEEVMADGC